MGEVYPFLAIIWQEAQLPINLVIQPPNRKYERPTEFVEGVTRRFQEIYKLMRKNQDTVIRRNAKLYTGKDHDYQVGTKVWYLCTRGVTGKPNKITDQWLGPYTITKKLSQVLYCIVPDEPGGTPITTHVTRLIRCQPGEYTKHRPPQG